MHSSLSAYEEWRDRLAYLAIFQVPTYGMGSPLFQVPTCGMGSPLFQVPTYGMDFPLEEVIDGRSHYITLMRITPHIYYMFFVNQSKLEKYTKGRFRFSYFNQFLHKFTISLAPSFQSGNSGTIRCPTRTQIKNRPEAATSERRHRNHPSLTIGAVCPFILADLPRKGKVKSGTN